MNLSRLNLNFLPIYFWPGSRYPTPYCSCSQQWRYMSTTHQNRESTCQRHKQCKFTIKLCKFSFFVISLKVGVWSIHFEEIWWRNVIISDRLLYIWSIGQTPYNHVIDTDSVDFLVRIARAALVLRKISLKLRPHAPNSILTMLINKVHAVTLKLKC